MVPDPSLTRRTVLGGAGALLGAAAVGTGLLAPTWLPDPVTDAALELTPDPPDHLWRPAVTEAHADDAVARLEAAVTEARRLRERVDTADVDDDVAFYLRGGDPSGGWLETAKSESDPHERLFDATYGMQFAGEVVGAAKVALGEVDAAAIVERGDRLRTAADDVRDSLGDYLVSDPARDLGRLYYVERELSLARLDSHRDGTFTGGVAPAESYDAGDVAGTVGSHLQAEQRIENARRYRDQYRENLADDPRPYRESLATALDSLVAEIDEYPRRHEFQEALRERDIDQSTPYGAARWELFTLCFDGDFRFGYDADGYRSGHLVQRTTEAARALLARRAHEFALSNLGVSPNDDGYDSGRALRAKRRAMRTFRSVRETHDSPFASVLAAEAASRIRAGHVGVSMADGDRPAWQPRVEATTYYLVGRGSLRELGDVFGTVVADER